MQPLAERLRPRTLDEYIGQKHLVGPGAVLRKMIDAGRISSFILWGPPGVGKTTLAQIIANALLLANACFDTLMKVGWPEGRIPLTEATIYLATSPKSNSAYMAINNALELVRETGNLPVPLHQRRVPILPQGRCGRRWCTRPRLAIRPSKGHRGWRHSRLILLYSWSYEL
jgi:replication-associated recombination protein RarA